jgi:hypothetical protein
LDCTPFETCTIPPGRLREEYSVTDSSRVRNKVRRLLCGQRQDKSMYTNRLSYLIDPTCEKKRREINQKRVSNGDSRTDDAHKKTYARPPLM